MKRRSLLVSIGTATIGTAGCLSDGGDRSTDDGPESSPDSETDRDGTDRTEAPGDGPTTELGPPPKDPLSDVDCPAFSESAERTVCWPHGQTDAEPIYMDASTVVFEPSPGDDSVESIEFVLHNSSGSAFGLNPHAWAIKRQTDSGWEHVAPEEWVEPWYTVESGESYTWRLSMTARTQAMAERTMAITEELDDGIYAFQITGIADERSDDPTHVECLALFEVQGS